MDFDELKAKLDEYIHEHSVTKFEAEDVVELIAEGEPIDWIVDQMKGDAPIDVDALVSLLTEMKAQIRPDQAAEEKAPAAPAMESGPPPADVSRLDLSQIGGMLPEGIEMPSGLDAKGIKSLIESPQGKIMADFLAFCQEKGLDLSAGSLKDPRVERLRNEWMSTPRDACDGKTPAEMLSQAQGKVETFRREAPRVGRNDPCPCGSGKKFKKCCGRT